MLSYFFRVFIGGNPRVLPLDLTQGFSTLWTPFRAIELVTLSNYFRVFI